MRISLRRVGLRFCGLVALLGLLSSPVHSQGARSGSNSAEGTQAVAVPNRISPDADWSRRVPLRNHLPLWANAQNSTGAASAEMTVEMVLSRSPEQQAALERLLADQKNPASPEFHHWLTPAEFGQRFGLSKSDIQSITNWLVAQGLRIHYVSPSRTFIGFGGSATAVGQAFGTQVRKYDVHGEARFSVSSDPLIPAPLAPVVKAVHGLYTVDDRPQHMMTEPQAAGPHLTLGNGAHYIVPGDFRTIYDEFVGATGIQQTIGIVGRSRTDFDDFSNFKRVTQSVMQMPTEVVPTSFGGVDPGPAYTTTPPQGVSLGEQSEATLDVTRAGSIAPNANLLLVVATSASGGIAVDAQYLIQSSPVPAQIINISYGACEAQAGQSSVVFWDTLFEQAAAEGISVFVSSGDSGASGCERAFTTPLASPPAISPNYICSSSYATCVGGTQFNDTANPSQYWGSNGSDLSSALQYIPEGGWNEPANSQGGMQVAGTGGGVSAFIATPKWQTGSGVPAERVGRYTPDVSFSGSCHDPYFACLAAGGASCVADSQGSFYFVGFCGTSASAPSMAGVAALLNEKMQFAQGNINPDIYEMAQNQPSGFHDTTPQSSGVTACDIHTPSMCNNSTPGPTGLTGGQDGYALTSGFDMVTGLGSLDIANFVTNFASALPQPTVTVTPSSQQITPADSLTVTVKLDGGSGQPVPTGTIKLTSNRYNPPDATLVNGTLTYNIPAYALPWSVDVDTFTAQYTPDSASSSLYSPALGSNWVAISALIPAVTVDLSSTSVSTADNVLVNVSVVGPSGAPTPSGTINIDAIGNGPGHSASATLSGGSATITIPAGTLPAGTDRIDTSYAPDEAAGLIYNVNSTDTNITVTQAPKTTPAVSSNLPSTITLADAMVIEIKVTPAAGAATPSGTVSLTGNGQTFSASLSAGSAQILTGAGWLPVGTDTLTISYSGDYNTNPVTATATLVVNRAVSSMTLHPSRSSINTDQTLNVRIDMGSAANLPLPTGTVTLSSGNYTSGAVSLTSSSIDISIPPGSLATGTIALIASYSGDSNFSPNTGAVTISVTGVPASVKVAGTDVTIATPGATTGNTSTITLTPAGGFTGTVNLTASVTSSPAGAKNPPTVSFGSTTPVTISGTAAVKATLTVTTTPTTTSAIVPPPLTHRNWYPAGGTTLGLLVLFGIPARRRKLRAWLGMLLLFAGVSIGMTACGGGSGSSTAPPPVTHPGTTAGTYVVTVTATSGAVSAKTTLQVIVD